MTIDWRYVAGMLLIIWVLTVVGGAIMFNEFRTKAVERHAAHWELDPKTGSTTFTWDNKAP